MENATSVPAIAVTAAVGAVVLLFILLCNIARKPQEEKGSYLIAFLRDSLQFVSALPIISCFSAATFITS